MAELPGSVDSENTQLVNERHISRGLNIGRVRLRCNVLAHAAKVVKGENGKYYVAERLGSWGRTDDCTLREVIPEKMRIYCSKGSAPSMTCEYDVVGYDGVPVELVYVPSSGEFICRLVTSSTTVPPRLNVLKEEEFLARPKDALPLNLPDYVYVDLRYADTDQTYTWVSQRKAWKITNDVSRQDLSQHLEEYCRNTPYGLQTQCQTLTQNLDEYFGVPTQPFQLPERVWQEVAPVLETGRLFFKDKFAKGFISSDISSSRIRFSSAQFHTGLPHIQMAGTSLEFLIDPRPRLGSYLSDPTSPLFTPLEFSSGLPCGPEREPLFYRKPQPYAHSNVKFDTQFPSGKFNIPQEEPSVNFAWSTPPPKPGKPKLHVTPGGVRSDVTIGGWIGGVVTALFRIAGMTPNLVVSGDMGSEGKPKISIGLQYTI